MRRTDGIAMGEAADTESVFRRLIGDDTINRLLARAASGRASPSAPRRLHALPADLPDFTGRDEEIAQVVALLPEQSGRAPVCGISGMGGAGKTALAVHAAHRLADTYPDGRIFVDLRGASVRPMRVREAMARVIHALDTAARLPDDAEETAKLYRATLEGRRVLVLLDDARDSAHALPLVPPTPCGLLVTSRRRLALPGLRRIDLHALAAEEAIKLLRRIVGDRRATHEELAEIATLCGRLPLALRAAANALRSDSHRPVSHYAAALRDERERQAALKHADLDVDAALGLSAAQLVRDDPRLAGRWQMLAVCPAPFDLLAATFLWQTQGHEARMALGALVNRSLVLYDAEAKSYRLHDLMRPVARNAFAYGGMEPDAEAARQRLALAASLHADYCLTTAKVAGLLYAMGGGRSLVALQIFDGLLPHLQAAWERMRRRSDDEALKWLVSVMRHSDALRELRLTGPETVEMLETAVAAARRTNDHENEALFVGMLGETYRTMGDARRAIEYHVQGLKMCIALGDRAREGEEQGCLGNAYADLGDLRRAIEHYHLALAVAQETGAATTIGPLVSNLGLAYHQLGEPRRALRYYRQSLKIAQQRHDLRGVADELTHIGMAFAALGKLQEAVRVYERALKVSAHLGDRRAEGHHLGNLANAHLRLGDPRRALELYQRALDIARGLGDRHAEGIRLGNMGLAHFQLFKMPEAVRYFEQAVDIMRETDDRRSQGRYLRNLGRAHLRLWHFRTGLRYWREGLRIARETREQR